MLGLLIFQLPEDGLCPTGKPFQSLVKAVISQQLSTQAAENIWNRFVELCPEIKPEVILRKHRRSLRATGMTERKIDYVYELSRFFQQENLTLEELEKLDDGAIIKKLCSINGIGIWTAEMFLIFSLGRPDVLPLSDIGVLRALSHLYFSNQNLRDLPAPGRQAEIKAITDKWRPWRTAATWYLWKSLSTPTITQ